MPAMFPVPPRASVESDVDLQQTGHIVSHGQRAFVEFTSLTLAHDEGDAAGRNSSCENVDDDVSKSVTDV